MSACAALALGCAKKGAPAPVAPPAPKPVTSTAPANPIGGCIQAICPFTTEQAMRPRPPGHRERIQADLTTVIEPMVNEQIRQASRAHGFGDLIDIFPKLNFDGVVLNDDLRVLVNLFHTLGALAYIEGRGLVDQSPKNGQSEFDHARAITLWRMHPIFADADESLAKATELIANTMGYRLFELREHVPLSWFFKRTAKKMTYRNFIKDTFEGLKHDEALVARAFPYLARPKSELMRRYEANQVISDQDSPALIREMSFYGMTAEALTSEAHRRALLDVKRDVVAEAQRSWRAIKHKNARGEARSPYDVRAYCLTRYREKLESFPTREEILAFDRDERVPTQSIAIAALRELGLDEGAVRLTSAAVNYPAPYARALKQIGEDLRTEIEFRRAHTDRLDHLHAALERGDQNALAEVLTLFAVNAIDDPREVNAVYGACEDISPTPMRDSTFDTEISVSWQILLRQLSLRTLAHEMGHAAFFAYKEDQRPAIMNDQIACLKRRHRGLEENPGHYVIEDYADLVGNEVTERLGDRRVTSLCDFVDDDSTVAQMSDERDTHSSSLFRLLVTAGDHRPPRCEAIVKAAGATNLAERCWRPATGAGAASP